MSFLTSATDVAIEKDLKQFLTILLVALSPASLPKIFAPLRQVPSTLLLLIVGLALALVEVRLIDLSPGMILMIFLPPLLFEAAWNMKWSHLQAEILPSSLYAVGGVLVSAEILPSSLYTVGGVLVSIAGVGWALHTFANISWMTALLVGACLSATDSASVIGLLRELGAGKRLTTLLEGESLFNDGAAVVAFSILVELAINSQHFELSTAVLRFGVVTGIGLKIGGLIGVCVALLTQRYELAWVEQALTLVTAYGTYLLVEKLGGSGVIGVVTAGLVIGNFSTQTGVEAVKRSPTTEFWEFAMFFVNSVLFLLLGDQIHISKLIGDINNTAIAILAVIASRALIIYGFSALTNWLANTNIAWRDQTILWWTGLRGSVSIALALSLPLAIRGREEIITNSFGVVWFTLLVQGLTTKFLLEKLNLLEDKSLYQQYFELVARNEALQGVFEHLSTKHQLSFSPAIQLSQLEFVKQQQHQLQLDIECLQEKHPQLPAYELQQHQQKLLSIEANTYTKFVQSGLLEKTLPPMMSKVFDSFRAD